MIISIAPLEKAFFSLVKAVERSIKEPQDLEVRDACIQRFEYTYELSIKILKRYLEQEMPLTEEIDQLNYRDLLRIAYEAGLITHIAEWFHYREARNQTSHAYDENKAQHVYDVLPQFIKNAKVLIEQLHKRLDKSNATS